MIRTDCYLAKMKCMKMKYPDAHFEEVHRASGNVLAPTVMILIETGIFKQRDGTKKPKDFVLYQKLYKEYIFSTPAAIRRMRELKEMAKTKDVFLVCLEGDAPALRARGWNRDWLGARD